MDAQTLFRATPTSQLLVGPTKTGGYSHVHAVSAAVAVTYASEWNCGDPRTHHYHSVRVTDTHRNYRHPWTMAFRVITSRTLFVTVAH